MKQKLNLIKLADVKAYIGLLDREEITMSRFAEILNECANEALIIHPVNHQRELLVDFMNKTQGNLIWGWEIGDSEKLADQYLKGNL
jgi:hypothetical protein